ncbi:sodium/glutamate symporter [Aminobacterium sp. MB27-C1]|jgi:ESS family glutamate:Na+ symporter|uniref:sodium/glutamate symporter n=1 Tax=Aminobacterium sp. MB27-C1 TaxID=3070661 RepID=UPI0027DAD384|nr:sodium/glutamate symporter [Aminobacterium sp. MB27-C1]WMI70835.1 sodium/glutamate symporter [Aminobacterium sp. MB27-C1]
MTWEFVDKILTLHLDGVWTTALAAILLMLGYGLRHKVRFFEVFCIPAPVIGGVLMSLIALVLHHQGGGAIKFNTALQSPMMIAFFTTVGIGGSFALLKKGGKALIVYLIFCWCLAVFQNGFGAGLAKLLGIHPALGIMAGAASLEGGHGAAAAFGPMAEELGVAGAKVVAIAAATYGLIAGGLLGGPLAKWLIDRHHVSIEASQEALYIQKTEKEKFDQFFSSFDFLKMLTLVLVIMVLGSFLSGKIKEWYNFSLPGYVGAMFVAVVFRNFNDHFSWVKIHDKAIELISDVSLGLFLTMAMMSLRIWELYDLAIPLIVILALQTIALLLIGAFLLFPLLGKDYDAAVMCAGFIGHGLGATPNAVANMGAVSERYQMMSHKAFLIVPLCGAVLIDLVGLPNIVWFINFLTK